MSDEQKVTIASKVVHLHELQTLGEQVRSVGVTAHTLDLSLWVQLLDIEGQVIERVEELRSEIQQSVEEEGRVVVGDQPLIEDGGRRGAA